MAKYTIELGTLINIGFTPQLSSYPIYDETHREELNNKIVNHFWFREIGQETPDRFNFYLKNRMNEIMPYYNDLYKLYDNDIDPFDTDNYSDIDKYDETHEDHDKGLRTDNLNESGQVTYGKGELQTNDLNTHIEVEGETSGHSDTVGWKDRKESDTPQTPIRKNWATDDDYYASNVGREDNSETDDTTSSQTQTTDTDNTGTVRHTSSGQDTSQTINTGTQKNDKDNEGEKHYTLEHGVHGYKNLDVAQRLKAYREAIINIDMMIIDDLECLFMQIY